MQTLPLMPYLNPMRLVLASRLLCTGNSEPRPKIVAEPIMPPRAVVILALKDFAGPQSASNDLPRLP